MIIGGKIPSFQYNPSIYLFIYFFCTIYLKLEISFIQHFKIIAYNYATKEFQNNSISLYNGISLYIQYFFHPKVQKLFFSNIPGLQNYLLPPSFIRIPGGKQNQMQWLYFKRSIQKSIDTDKSPITATIPRQITQVSKHRERQRKVLCSVQKHSIT